MPHDIVPISKVTELTGGGTPSRATPAFFGGSIPWVTPSDLLPIGEVAELGAVREALTEEGLATSSARLLRPPAVLFSSRASIGKIAVATASCTTNQGFINFLPDTTKLDPWFLAYYLRHKTPEILLLAGETTYKEVSRGKMRDFPLWLPPLSEQQRIVERIQSSLVRVKEITDLRREAQIEAEALLCNVIDAFVDPAWPRVSLGELCTEIRNGWSGKQDQNGVTVGALRLSCVHGLTVNAEDTKSVVVNEKTAKEFSIRNGDVFVVRGNGSKHLVGRSAIVCQDRADVIFNDLLIRLVFRETALSGFVNFVLHIPEVRRQIEGLSKTAAGIWKINQTNLGHVEVPSPSIEVQAKVVEKVTEAREAGWSLLGLSHADTLPLVEAILRHAFAGEL